MKSYISEEFLKNLINPRDKSIVVHLLSMIPDIKQDHLTSKEVIEKLSQYHDMNEDKVIYKILDILFSILCGRDPHHIIGKHNTQVIDINEEELKKGINVEYEHTDIPWIAEAIARDHLAECSNYYTRLEEMEQKCKQEGNFDA